MLLSAGPRTVKYSAAAVVCTLSSKIYNSCNVEQEAFLLPVIGKSVQ